MSLSISPPLHRRQFITGSATALLVASLPYGAHAEFEISPERARQIRYLGKPDAPIIVAEYFSLTCSHCGDFHRNTFPQVKSELIDKGKIRFELYPFPFDRIGLSAHALCRVLPNASYFKMVDLLLEQQAKWVGANEPLRELKKYAKYAGISEQNYGQILSHQAFLEAIVDMRRQAEIEHNIGSTPSFLINKGRHFSGAVSFDEFLSRLKTFGI